MAFPILLRPVCFMPVLLLLVRAGCEQEDAFEGTEALRRSRACACFAQDFARRGDWDKARSAAQEALRVWSENWEARHFLGAHAHSLFARWDKEINERSPNRTWCGVDDQDIRITKSLLDGRRFLNAFMFKEALEEFDRAEVEILLLSSGPHMGMNALLQTAIDERAKVERALGICR